MSRTYIALAALAVALTGCKDHFDLDTLNNKPKLVLYSFPSQADTTYISVTNSMGVTKYTDTRHVQFLSQAHVSYTVDGVALPVGQTDGYFYVVTPHEPAHHVGISVACDGFDAVSAQTTVPTPVPIVLEQVKATSEYDFTWMETMNFHKLLATFTDPVGTADYYAVRVVRRMQNYQNRTLITYPEIFASHEPLLQGISDIDEDFGFENEYYGQLCIFNDQGIDGQTYTMHLNVEALRVVVDGSADMEYQVELFHITPEYYKFLKSINDVENNELAQGGFAQLMPTFTNVSHGVGVVGGFWQQSSAWMRVEQ